MPTFYSHDFPQFEMPGLKEYVERPGIQLDGNTLGELLMDLELKTGVYVIACDEPKYFRYYESRQSADFITVDIHIERGGEIICPKQDLNFPILPTDKIEAGMLAC